MTWRALFDRDECVNGSNVVDEILAGVALRPTEERGLDGAGSEACLLAYAAQASSEGAQFTDRAAACLENCIGAGPVASPALWGGNGGLRFAVAHLAADDDVTGDAITILDQHLASAVNRERWNGDYDIVSGLVGIGVSALEGDTESGNAVARRVVQLLERDARQTERGTTWFTPPELLPEWQRVRHPGGYYNLGLAHGVPGPIAFLAACVERSVEEERARRLLREAVTWLLEAVPARAPRRYPAWLAPEVSVEPCRLAWCYGDPGVCIALLQAARAMKDAMWEGVARQLMRNMAACPDEESGVMDGGICHGAAGLGHIFNRLYQATGEECAGEAARHWFRKLLAMRREDGIYGGFRSRRVEAGREYWVDDASMLTGATGIGLTLLAACTDIEPSWDRAILCDVAPLERA